MRKIAIIGGVGYLIIFITGIFANFGVMESLKVPGNSVQSFENFQLHKGYFQLGLLSFIAMVIADLVLTWALSELFHAVNPQLNRLTAWFRLVNVALFGVALFHLFDLHYLLSLSPEVGALKAKRALNSFNVTWLIGLVFFGIHLLLLSKLLCQAKTISKVVSLFLFIAGIGYVVDSFLQFFMPDYQSISHISALIVVLPGIIGELSLTFWLLLKGGRHLVTNK